MISRIFQTKVIQSSICVFCAVIVFGFNSNAQTTLPKYAVQISGGDSKHGSGDINGIVFGTEFIKYYKKRLSLNFNIRGSIHTGKDKLYVTDMNTNIRKDNSLVHTTAGVQMGTDAGFSLIRNLRHEFQVSVGSFVRYQSASSSVYRYYLPDRTGQPAILVEFYNIEPFETFSLGGLFRMQYSFKVNKKLYVALSPSFQTDTNGDAILSASLLFGRSFY